MKGSMRKSHLSHCQHEFEMKVTMVKQLSASITVLSLSIPEFADDVNQIIADFQNGTLPISKTGTPISLPFAMEWDALASNGEYANTRAKPEQYLLFTVPDESRLKASIDALSQNDKVIDLLLTVKPLPRLTTLMTEPKEPDPQLV